nr:Serine/threonine-protein kinase HT1 [Ipomoea batatas]
MRLRSLLAPEPGLRFSGSPTSEQGGLPAHQPPGVKFTFFLPSNFLSILSKTGSPWLNFRAKAASLLIILRVSFRGSRKIIPTLYAVIHECPGEDHPCRTCRWQAPVSPPLTTLGPDGQHSNYVDGTRLATFSRAFLIRLWNPTPNKQNVERKDCQEAEVA